MARRRATDPYRSSEPMLLEPVTLEPRGLVRANGTPCTCTPPGKGEVMVKKKVGQITIEVKDPDGWGEVVSALGLNDEQRDRFFLWGEYATLDLEVAEDMTVTGRIVPRK